MPPASFETVLKIVEPPKGGNESEVVARTRTAGGDATLIPTHVLSEGAESDDAETEMSGSMSERSGAESDDSGEWVETRSKATSPASSVSASSRRRSDQEGREGLRRTDAADTLRSLGQSAPRGVKSKGVPRVKGDAKSTLEAVGPDELASRSTQLIEQLQRFIQERGNATGTPRDDPFTCRDRREPWEAVSLDGGRGGPVTSQFFETALGNAGTRGRRYLDNILNKSRY